MKNLSIWNKIYIIFTDFIYCVSVIWLVFVPIRLAVRQDVHILDVINVGCAFFITKYTMYQNYFIEDEKRNGEKNV